MAAMPDPSSLHFACIHCLLLVRSYEAATAHLVSKHGIDKPDRHLDVVQTLADPQRSLHIAMARTEAARRLLASAERSQDHHAKRRLYTETTGSPAPRPKVPRIIIKDNSITTAVQVAKTNYHLPPLPPPPPASPPPTFLLRTRGAQIQFTPPSGVDSYHGLLTSVAAAYDHEFPGAPEVEFDWLAAAETRWMVVIGKRGGGVLGRVAVAGDGDVARCLRPEVGGKVRIMEVGEQV